MRVFVAGAAGAIGQRLVPQLVAAGHVVVATTCSQAKIDALRALGAEAVVLDGLDGVAVGEAVGRAEPDVIVHQMTSLAGMGVNLRKFDRYFATTNELRTAGTDHLLAAAAASGVPRFIAQSYTGWPNSRAAGRITTEQDPLNSAPPAAQRRTLEAITYLERAVTHAPLDGLVLRYGSLYGPGASEKFAEMVRARKFPLVGAGTGVWSFAHVDDAASATVAAIQHGGTGVYNVVDDEPAEVSVWLPYVARVLGASEPRHLPVWLARGRG
jgi:nucleoside-diphosphate-sugar epimerase